MQQTHTAIHTFTYDERLNFTDSSDARYWSLAMIANDYWFQIDTYIHIRSVLHASIPGE